MSNGIAINTDYSIEDYYVVETNTNSFDIYDNSNNKIENFTFNDVPKTKSNDYIQRYFSNTKYARCNGYNIAGAKNEVLLEIYANGSFKQIERVIDNSVYAADGVSNFSISSSTQSAISPTGKFPATSLDCTYRATCTGSLDASETSGISVSLLESAGIEVSKTTGTIYFFTATIKNSYSISVY